MTERTGAVGKAGSRVKILGVIMMILGLLAIFSPLAVGLSVVMLIGILVLVGGLVRMYWAFQAGSLGRGILSGAIGVLTLVCGILILANPIFGSGVLTVILATYFLVDGVFEIIVSLQARPASGWGFVLFSGVVSLLLAIFMWRQFPLSGAWAIGIFIGIKLLLAGFIMTAVGATVRTIAKEAAAG